jgi:hypothetical protein
VNVEKIRTKVGRINLERRRSIDGKRVKEKVNQVVLYLRVILKGNDLLIINMIYLNLMIFFCCFIVISI